LGSNNIRIASISPGLVETEFLYAMYEETTPGKAEQIYHSSPVLEGQDIAEHVRHILELPKHVQIHDILVRPTQQKN
jgi:NADP-dependent 3-hydroxy acid dehydrogenase YdfG